MSLDSVHGGLNHEVLQRFSREYQEWQEKEVSKKREKNTEDRLVTDSSLPVQKIHGFNNEIKSLKHFLLDQKVYKEFKTLVIVGEYGVGKTALCKTIFNDDDVKSVYVPRIWVSLPSKEPTLSGDPEEQKKMKKLNGKICVLKEILTSLGVEAEIFNKIHDEAHEEIRNRQETGEFDGKTVEEKELAALLYALHLDLRWKKYLIVLDNVREEDHWDEILQDDEVKLKEDNKWGKYLSDGFPKGSGGRVIYTSRDENEDLAKKLVAEEHEIHRIWPLTDIGSIWNIYTEELQKNEITPPRIDKKCIDELMNKSRGLPLAAKLLATLLPVFIDDKKTDLNGATQGTTGQPNNPTTENNKIIPPQQALGD